MANYNETHFAREIASKKRYPEIYGQVEASLQSKAGRIRVDILTDKHAYECKFGSTCWKTAIGQALTYARLSERKPGIVVLIRTNPKYMEKDLKGYNVMMETIEHYKLKIDVRRFYVNREDGSISKRNSLEWVEPEAAPEPTEVAPPKKILGLFKRK